MPTPDIPVPPAVVLDEHDHPRVTTDSPAERAWYPAYLAPA
jgi:hypothetical protein